MALQEVLAHLGFDVDLDNLDKADGAVGKVFKSWAAVAGAVATAAGALQVLNFAAESARAGAELQATAEAAGTSARALAQWRDAVVRAGGDVAQLGGGTLAFSKFLVEARRGGEEQRKTLRRLGVDLRNADGSARDAGAAFEDAVLALGDVEDAAKRAAVADQLFGGAGESLVKVALRGADALDEQRRRFDELNPDLELYVERAADADQALKEWDAAGTALKQTLAIALLPALEGLARAATTVAEWFSRTSAGSHVVEVGLIAVAAAAAVAGVAMISAFIVPIAIVAAVAAAIAAVVLVVDDLIALFTGGKSAIGQALDQLFGFGTAERVVAGVKDAAASLVEWLSRAGAVGARVWRALGPPAEALWDLYVKVAKLGVGAVVSAIQGLYDVGTRLAEALGLTWQGVADGIAAAVEVVVQTVERALELATGAIDKVSGAVDSISSWLFDDEEDGGAQPGAGGVVRGAPRALLLADAALAAREFSGGAAEVPRPFGGAFSAARATPAPAALPDVRVSSQNTIRVEGAGDPDAVAARVEQRMREAQERDAEFTREALLGRPAPR
jgi:hypothetical protein